MQGKKNKMMALRVLVLLVASAILYFTTREKEETVMNKDLFKPGDVSVIDKIVLTSRTHKVELARESNRWRVNGQFDADVNMIKILFETLKSADVRWPVAASVSDSVRSWLSQSGTSVSILSEGKSVINFTAGGVRKRNESWFLMEGEKQPYEMIIPGYKVYVSGILELDESGWRNKRVFDFNWRNFKSLKASYRKEPRQGFEVELKGSYFGINGMETVDTTKLNNYLDAVSLLFANNYVGKNKVIDSLSAIEPAIQIEINDIASRAYKLDLFTPRRNDPEVYGRLGTGEWITLDRNEMGAIVWKRDYFMVKE